MVQTDNSQPVPEIIPEKVFTPEPFSPNWDNDPNDLLDIPLDFPYSAKEWDAIFEAFLDLLENQDYWTWSAAIGSLIYALEMEASQHTNCEDYRPKPINERMQGIFAGIATQALNNQGYFILKRRLSVVRLLPAKR